MSSFAAEDPNCVLGIWERDALLDFNQVVVKESATDPTKFNIMLIQKQEILSSLKQ